MWRYLAIALFVISVAPAAADEAKPSFDCGAARSAAEKMICSDVGLASWDQTLADAYKDALRAGKADKASQQEWLRRRDAECATGDVRRCLLRRIRLRVATLQSAAGAGPSFNCDAARSDAEYAICAEADLAQLDLVVANAYRHALDAGKVSKASQVAWLKRRDAVCDDADKSSRKDATQSASADVEPSPEFATCLQGHMQRRLAELQAAYGFAYGTAVCNRTTGTAAVTFDIPRVPPIYLLAEYSTIFPDRLFSWRCNPSPKRSVTVKFGFEPFRPCAILSVWENGVKILDKTNVAQCNRGGPMLQAVRVTPSGLVACYSLDSVIPNPRCYTTARTKFATAKDPFFLPGRLPGEPEPALALVPMRPLQGKDDPRCKILTERLARNWNDEFADLEAKVGWRNVEFANDRRFRYL